MQKTTRSSAIINHQSPVTTPSQSEGRIGRKAIQLLFSLLFLPFITLFLMLTNQIVHLLGSVVYLIKQTINLTHSMTFFISQIPLTFYSNKYERTKGSKNEGNARSIFEDLSCLLESLWGDSREARSRKRGRGRPSTPPNQLLAGILYAYLKAIPLSKLSADIFGSSPKYRKFMNDLKKMGKWSEIAKMAADMAKAAGYVFPPNQEERFLKGLPPVGPGRKAAKTPEEGGKWTTEGDVITAGPLSTVQSPKGNKKGYAGEEKIGNNEDIGTAKALFITLSELLMPLFQNESHEVKKGQGRPPTPLNQLLAGILYAYLKVIPLSKLPADVFGSPYKYQKYMNILKKMGKWFEIAQLIVDTVKAKGYIFPPGMEERFVKGLPPVAPGRKAIKATKQRNQKKSTESGATTAVPVFAVQRFESDEEEDSKEKTVVSNKDIETARILFETITELFKRWIPDEEYELLAGVTCAYLLGLSINKLYPEVFGSPQRFRQYMNRMKEQGKWHSRSCQAANIVNKKTDFAFLPGWEEGFLWGSLVTKLEREERKGTAGFLLDVFQSPRICPPPLLNTSKIPPGRFYAGYTFCYVTGTPIDKLPTIFGSNKDYIVQKELHQEAGMWDSIKQFIVDTIDKVGGKEINPSPKQKKAFLEDRPLIIDKERTHAPPIEYQEENRQYIYNCNEKNVIPIVSDVLQRCYRNDIRSIIKLLSSHKPGSVEYKKDLILYLEKFLSQLEEEQEERQDKKKKEKEQKKKQQGKQEGGKKQGRKRKKREQPQPMTIATGVQFTTGDKSLDSSAMEDKLFQLFGGEEAEREFLSTLTSRKKRKYDRQAFIIHGCRCLGGKSYRFMRKLGIGGNYKKFKNAHDEWVSDPSYESASNQWISYLRRKEHNIPEKLVDSLQRGQQASLKFTPEEEPRRKRKKTRVMLKEKWIFKVIQFVCQYIGYEDLVPSERKKGTRAGRPSVTLSRVLYTLYRFQLKEGLNWNQMESIIGMLRDLGEEFVSPRVLRKHLKKWGETKGLKELRATLVRIVHELGGFDLVVTLADGSLFKAENHHAFVGYIKNKGKGILIMMLTDKDGKTIHRVVGSPNEGEHELFRRMMKGIPLYIRKDIKFIVADKGFDSVPLRKEMAELGISLQVENKSSLRDSAHTYVEFLLAKIFQFVRGNIERKFGRLKREFHILKELRLQSVESAEVYFELLHIFEWVSG